MARIRKFREINPVKVTVEIGAEGLVEAREILRYVRKKRIDVRGKQAGTRLKRGFTGRQVIRKGSAVISGKQALQLVRAKRILGSSLRACAQGI